MQPKENVKRLYALIQKWDLSQKKLAKLLDIPTDVFSKKMNIKYPYYKFSAWDIFTIATEIDVMADELHAHYKKETKLYFANKEAEKFQTNLKNPEGVVKKETIPKFPGGTLVVGGAGSNFRPIPTSHVVMDCEEQGTPVDIRPDWLQDRKTIK